MSEWKLKRFWKAAGADTDPGEVGYRVLLDGRPVRTPAKALLAAPTRAMALAIAAEWDAQEAEIDPTTMPMTRAANAAIDKVAVQRAEVADMLAAYGDSDLLCYRAEAPEELVARQAEAWDPALDWAAAELGARLEVFVGVIHAPQPPEALARLAREVHGLTAFQLAAFHDLVSLSGSLVLGLAAARGWREADALWAMSRIDETWQEEQWGYDEEAAEAAEVKARAFLDAKRFFDLS